MLSIGQNLFKAIANNWDVSALEGEMIEIVKSVEKDNETDFSVESEDFQLLNIRQKELVELINQSENKKLKGAFLRYENQRRIANKAQFDLIDKEIEKVMKLVEVI